MQRKTKLFKTLGNLVGAGRFELPTSCAQGKRATRLRHAPNRPILPIFSHRVQPMRQSSLAFPSQEYALDLRPDFQGRGRDLSFVGSLYRSRVLFRPKSSRSNL